MRFLCRMNIHNWTNWSERYEAKIGTRKFDASGNEIVELRASQKLVCQSCNIERHRRLVSEVDR